MLMLSNYVSRINLNKLNLQTNNKITKKAKKKDFVIKFCFSLVVFIKNTYALHAIAHRSNIYTLPIYINTERYSQMSDFDV